jgi:GNAT superfamily N-acetyltransferase
MRIGRDAYGFSENPFFWVTRNGREILIVEMEDEHLARVVNFLRVWAHETSERMFRAAGGYSLDKETADDAGDQVDPEVLLHGIAPYKELINELLRRRHSLSRARSA